MSDSYKEPDGIIDGVVVGWPSKHPACVSFTPASPALAEANGIYARLITRLEVFTGEEQTTFRFGGMATTKENVPKILREMATALNKFAEELENP